MGTHHDDLTPLGRLVAEVMTQTGWSRREIARRGGIGDSTIDRMLDPRQRYRPLARTLLKFAHNLDQGDPVMWLTAAGYPMTRRLENIAALRRDLGSKINRLTNTDLERAWEMVCTLMMEKGYVQPGALAREDVSTSLNEEVAWDDLKPKE